MNNKRNTFYITTPIYYVNDVPHIGHAYTTIAADVMARYKRLAGYEVFFLTGTDEHGQKVEKAAVASNEKPAEFVDRVSRRFKDLWVRLNISNNDFIRTTEARHYQSVQELFKRVKANNDIYLGEYEDWYCTPCEKYWSERELENGNCPDCGRKTEKLKEKSYFFRMSRYGDKLLRYIEKNPDCIQPEAKRNEIISFVKEGLRDLSISRTSFSWGIPVPDDSEHVIYVWFDALTNYITAAGFPGHLEKFSKFWPADVHLIGKDILRFHTVYWPTFLFSAGIPVARKVFAHGWWTIEGQKMSKSLGNVVDPNEIVDEFGVDAFRYFLLKEVPFGLDGDFSRAALIHRINSDLANDLGNLVSRVIAMILNFSKGIIPECARESSINEEIRKKVNGIVMAIDTHMDNLAFSQALILIWDFIGELNRYVDKSAPWVLAKSPGKNEELKTVLYTLGEGIRIIAILIYPFMPQTALKIFKRLGLDEKVENVRLREIEEWGGLSSGLKVVKGEALFPRIEDKGKKEEPKKQKEIMPKIPTIDINEFSRVDLRVGEVKSVEKVQGSKKLLKMTVDIGKETRTLIAGIGKCYSEKELIEKKVVIVTNLQPTVIMGIKSEGMVLAGGEEENLGIVTVDKNIPVGTKIK